MQSRRKAKLLNLEPSNFEIQDLRRGRGGFSSPFNDGRQLITALHAAALARTPSQTRILELRFRGPVRSGTSVQSSSRPGSVLTEPRPFDSSASRTSQG